VCLKRSLSKNCSELVLNGTRTRYFVCHYKVFATQPELVGTAVDGRQVRGLVRDQGDPGNRATVKFVCEAALSLVLQTNSLPDGQTRGGILTPATGLGDVLAERLRRAGMTIEVNSSL